MDKGTKKPTINRTATMQNIKQKMEQKDISIKEMAQALDVSYQAVWKYINNKTFPSLTHLYIIAQELNCMMAELIVKS